MHNDPDKHLKIELLSTVNETIDNAKFVSKNKGIDE
jgi:hypothetical protein